jgi:hypothetical protein
MARRKSGININPANRGKFTAKGISVSQGLSSRSKKTRAQANFARMAKRGWKPLGSSSSSSGSKKRKSHVVKSHTRTLSSGKTVRVKRHRRSKKG